MTKEQIQKYEYCNNYIKYIDSEKPNVPFSNQHFGCGSRSPNIERDLQVIHQTMYSDIIKIINKAIEDVCIIVEGI